MAEQALLYERDFAAWIEQQAGLLRERRFAELDLDNLIEEVEGLRRAEVHSAQHHAEVVVAQLLQLAHSTLGDPRWSWKVTANSHRRQLRRRLSPSLLAELEGSLQQLYDDGRDTAATVLECEGTNAAAVPQDCPWTLAQILEEDWFPSNVYGFDRLDCDRPWPR
jgi:hypothetical protein